MAMKEISIQWNRSTCERVCRSNVSRNNVRSLYNLKIMNKQDSWKGDYSKRLIERDT